MNNTEKFSGKADIYAKARPCYATKFIEWLFSDLGINNNSVVADIGSGTGIFTKALLEKQATVYAVEPNEDMRLSAEKSLNSYLNFHSVCGTAENTTLADNSVDFITVAQAFHWFNAEHFKKECQRILKPNGKVILVWNSRVNTSELVMQNALICKKYCPNFRGFSGGLDNIQQTIINFFNRDFIKIQFVNDLYFDNSKFIERMLSASYSLKEADVEYNNYINELKNLFDKYAINDNLTIPNETVAYCGRV